MSLKLARKIAGLSQTTLAKRSGVDPGLLSRLEHGERSLRQTMFPTVAALAAVLNLTPHELVDLVEPEQPTRVGDTRTRRRPRRRAPPRPVVAGESPPGD